MSYDTYASSNHPVKADRKLREIFSARAQHNSLLSTRIIFFLRRRRRCRIALNRHIDLNSHCGTEVYTCHRYKQKQATRQPGKHTLAAVMQSKIIYLGHLFVEQCRIRHGCVERQDTFLAHVACQDESKYSIHYSVLFCVRVLF